MQQLLEQAWNETRSVMRFRWWGMSLAWVICLAGWAWVGAQPDIYQANARVYVDSSSVLEPVLGNRIVTPNVATQLTYVREALLGREQLEKVALDTGLADQVTTTDQLDAIIAGLRQAVQIQLGRGARNSADGVYTISYRNSNRAHAVSVVDEILDTFVESTIGVNRQQGDTAERFLDERVHEYEVRLEAAEAARAAFVKENAERLPGNQGGYFARLRSERDALDQSRRELAILQSRRNELLAQLTGESAVIPDGSAVGVDPAPGSIDARIRDLETRRDELLIDFTPAHPDVIAIEEALDRLIAQRNEQLEALGVAGVDTELAALEANPVFQSLQMAINQVDVEIAAVQADIGLREERVAELQGLIDEVPEVEAQLARLNRDYEVIYEQYLALVRSRETQDLTRQAMDTDQIDFRVIDPPLAAPTPVAPDRMILISLVFVAAIGAGGGLCYLLAQLRPVFQTRNALRLKTHLPVLGAVANAWPEMVAARRLREAVLYAAASMCLLAAYGGIVAVEMVGPGLRQLIA